MKNIYLIPLLLILWPGCNTDTPCPNGLQLYTVQPGSFAARPPVFHTSSGESPAGEWEIILVDGWEYELPSNQSQWLKLCGDSFRFIPSNKDNVMLAGRYLNGVIEIAPYYNVNSAQLYWETAPDGWPKIEVQPGELINFRYYVAGGNVVTEINYNGVEYLHSINHSGITDFTREINFYAGGSVPPVAEISLKKRRIGDCEGERATPNDTYTESSTGQLIGTWAYVRTFKSGAFDKRVYGHMEVTPEKMMFGRVGWIDYEGTRHEYSQPLQYEDVYEETAGVIYMPYFNYDMRYAIDTLAVDTALLRNIGNEISIISMKK